MKEVNRMLVVKNFIATSRQDELYFKQPSARHFVGSLKIVDTPSL